MPAAVRAGRPVAAMRAPELVRRAGPTPGLARPVELKPVQPVERRPAERTQERARPVAAMPGPPGAPEGGTTGDAPTTDDQGGAADQGQGTDANQEQGTDADQEQNTDVDQEQNTDVDQEQNTDVNQEQNTEVNVEQNVEITTEQRTVIRERIIEADDYEPVVDINFNISIGVSVPQTIRYYPLAPTLIEIVPAEWHDYVFCCSGRRQNPHPASHGLRDRLRYRGLRTRPNRPERPRRFRAPGLLRAQTGSDRSADRRNAAHLKRGAGEGLHAAMACFSWSHFAWSKRTRSYVERRNSRVSATHWCPA
jgi:hypothetical protein